MGAVRGSAAAAGFGELPCTKVADDAVAVADAAVAAAVAAAFAGVVVVVMQGVDGRAIDLKDGRGPHSASTGGAAEYDVVANKRVGRVAQLGLDAEAQIAHEVFVAAPMAISRRTAGANDAGALHGVDDRAGAELVFLDAAVADKGAQDERVGGGGGEKQFDGGEQGAELLVAVLLDNAGGAVDGDADNAQAQREEEDKLDLAFDGLVAEEDDWNREEDEQEVRDDVAHGHGQQLGKALSTVAARVGIDSPVVGEGLALSQVADHDGDKGGYENAANGDEGDLGEAFRQGIADALEELEDSDLEDP